MNRFAVLAIVMSALFGSAFGAVAIVRAQDAPMTDAHIARIRSNCVEAQTQLTQLHATDALLRVNRGQLYEQISTKLMSPLNSRIALNKLDGASLVTITASYDQQLMTFRTLYQQYEEAISALLRMNCVNQPVAFYDGVADARSKRAKVHDSTVVLQQSILAYGNEFAAFREQFLENQ
jgi:hypothetical protein